MWKTAKMLVLVVILTSTSGCQLLIDNRNRESGAVVVVPSDEWDTMRQASLAASQAITRNHRHRGNKASYYNRANPWVRSHQILKLYKFQPWRLHHGRYH